jgi:hypothetical protein
MVRVWFALAVDLISRVWNGFRIVCFVALLAGLVSASVVGDHATSGKMLWDFLAGGVLAWSLGKWIRIDF